jgi:tetratricopeptide (TPR) repeat protein
MKSLLSLLFLSLLCFAPVRGIRAEEEPLAIPHEEFGILQRDWSRVYKAASTYPPDLSSKEDRAEVEKIWKDLEKRLGALVAANPANAGLKTQLGDLYRMGHNLDIEGAGDNAEKTLRLAIALGPKEYRGHYVLGIYFGGSGQFEKAVKELEIALGLAAPDDRLQTVAALANTYYFAKRFDKVIPLAEEFLKARPNDPVMTLIKTRSEEALAGGRVPRTIELPATKRPEEQLKRAPASATPAPAPEPTKAPAATKS